MYAMDEMWIGGLINYCFYKIERTDLMNFKISVKELTEKEAISICEIIGKVSYRIDFDIENNLITVFDANDVEMETFINATYKVCQLQKISVFDNETVVEKEDTSKIIEMLENEVSEDVLQQAKYLFENILWSKNTFNLPDSEVKKVFLSMSSEITRMYNVDRYSQYAIGDVVDCAFGYHIRGEISGGHVLAIVCDVLDNGLIWVVPVSKQVITSESKEYLSMWNCEDVIYKSNFTYSSGTVLLRKGCCIHKWRINDVVGYTTDSFFERVIKALPQNYDFSNKEK